MSKFVSTDRAVTTDWGVAHKKPVQSETGAFFPSPGRQRHGSEAHFEAASDLVAIIEAKRGAWSASELAELLGCSGKHIYALAKSGRMPHLRIGGMIRFDPRATAEWLRERVIAA